MFHWMCLSCAMQWDVPEGERPTIHLCGKPPAKLTYYLDGGPWVTNPDDKLIEQLKLLRISAHIDGAIADSGYNMSMAERAFMTQLLFRILP